MQSKKKKKEREFKRFMVTYHFKSNVWNVICIKADAFNNLIFFLFCAAETDRP